MNLIIYVIFLKRTAGMRLMETLINNYTLGSKKHVAEDTQT